MTLRIYANPPVLVQPPTVAGNSFNLGLAPRVTRRDGTSRQEALLRQMVAGGEFRGITPNDHAGELTRSYLSKYLGECFGKPKRVESMPESLRDLLNQAQRAHLLRYAEADRFGRGRWQHYPVGYKPRFANDIVELKNDQGRLAAKIRFENGSFRIQRALRENVERFTVSLCSAAVANRLDIDFNELERASGLAKKKPGQIYPFRNRSRVPVGIIYFAEGLFCIETPALAPRVRVLHIAKDSVRRDDAGKLFTDIYMNDYTMVLLQIEGYAGGNPIHFVMPPLLTVDDVQEEFEVSGIGSWRATGK